MSLRKWVATVGDFLTVGPSCHGENPTVKKALTVATRCRQKSGEGFFAAKLVNRKEKKSLFRRTIRECY
jgi:hypothetical protein